MIAALCHSRDSGWVQIDDLSKLSDLRTESGNVLWVEADVASLSDEDVALIVEEFGFPADAIEDAVNTLMRPKVEPFNGTLLFVMHQLDEIDDQLEASQIAGFIGERFVLTIHNGAQRTLDEAKKRWGNAKQLPAGPAELLHTLTDVVVDDYQEHSDRLEDEMENLEEIALQAPDAPVSVQLYGVKQQIARLRRYVFPAARLLDWVLDPDPSDRPFNQETAMLFRDVHDHLMRITDQVKNIDDLSQAIIDFTRAYRDQALNVTTRKLTAWAAIFAVGTLIAGIYGMNFRLVPRDQTLFGFWFAISLMVVTGVGLYLYFREKDWL